LRLFDEEFGAEVARSIEVGFTLGGGSEAHR